MSGNTFGKLFTVTTFVRVTAPRWAPSSMAARRDSRSAKRTFRSTWIAVAPAPRVIPPSAGSPTR